MFVPAIAPALELQSHFLGNLNKFGHLVCCFHCASIRAPSFQAVHVLIRRVDFHTRLLVHLFNFFQIPRRGRGWMFVQEKYALLPLHVIQAQRELDVLPRLRKSRRPIMAPSAL